MAKNNDGVKVSILDKEFTVACKEDEREELIAAAAHLDKQMRAIQGRGKVMGLERCAIMAGLNLAHELLSLQRNHDVSEDVTRKIQSLQARIVGAIGETRQSTM